MINDKKSHIIYGLKGSGKTTYVVRKARQALKKGFKVFSNIPIEGTFQIQVSDLKKSRIPSNSIIIIDEAASEINCRNWRDTTVDLIESMQLIRHFESTIFWVTQSISAIDNQIADLCDDAIYAEKFFEFSKYTKFFKLYNKKGDAIFQRHRGIPEFIFRKKYYRFFDSNYISPKNLKKPELEVKPW